MPKSQLGRLLSGILTNITTASDCQTPSVQIPNEPEQQINGYGGKHIEKRKVFTVLQALYMLQSVCPSVTLQYCVKTRERTGMRSSPSGSLVSRFLMPRMVGRDDPVQVKFKCKKVTHVKTAYIYSRTHFAS